MIRFFLASAIPWATFISLLPASQAETTFNVGGPTFAELDKNNDKRLSPAEYARGHHEPKALIRDFRLFDWDQDGHLSSHEFASMSPGESGSRPGPTADPFTKILERAVDAMDQSYDGWQHRKDETVDTTTFTINFSASISTDGRRRLDRVMILHADPNRDRKVSREEARRFLEIQLGIRWVTGDLLREPNGAVVDFAEFTRSDANQDNELDKDEFLDNWFNGTSADTSFQRLDINNDQKVTLGEFSSPEGPNIRDPIEMFRNADTNLDALLDAPELHAAIPKRRAYLIESNLAGFDEDGDERLSLREFRVSMLGNYNCPWENMPKDENRDQLLSFDEFKFDARNLFQLQRRYYFHKLDTDGDDKLSEREFEFRRHKLYSLYRISVNGEESREIYQHEDFPVCGSPAVSPDGRWILFDATPPEGANRSQILLMTSEGADARDLCDGLMPTWSKDGNKFACSRYEGGSGVWIMNMDGTPDKRIDDGWAAQWSPDGNSIAYTNDNSLRVYDVNSGQTRIVLPKGSTPYQYIYWNMCWSPDSKRLVFKGKLAGKNEIAIVNMTGEPNLKKHFATNEEMGADFAWSPDGRRILFNMYSQEHQRTLIYQIDLESNDPPKIVPEAITALPWTTLCFSPSGEWMVLATPN